MLKRLTNKLSENPAIYTFLRKIIENNFKSHRLVIADELPNPGLLLDVPCGIGEFSVFFDHDDYLGVDISENYVGYAKKKYGKRFLVGDATRLNLGDGTFDSVLVSSFFHHLNEEDVDRVLGEIYRVLKKDGKFVLIEAVPGKNFVSRALQRYDVGVNIRKHGEYFPFLKTRFNIEKVYPMKSGLWYYSVFVMRK